MSRAPRRAARAPPARTQSMRGESGNAHREADSPNSDSRAPGKTATCSRGSHEISFDFCRRNLSRGHADQDVAAPQACLLMAKQLPQHALHAVAIDRAGEDALGDDEAEPRDAECVDSGEDTEARTLERSPAGEQRGDVGGAEPQPSTVSAADSQTLNRARPLARRARITARPPRVRMRTRNPWVRFLRRTEG